MNRLLWIGMLFLGFSCQNSQEKLRKFALNPDMKKETGKDVTVLYSDSGKVTARIMAPTMLRDLTDKPVTEMPDGIEAIFYDRNGEISSKLTANRAINYTATGTMEAYGNVIVINELGDTLRTEKLIWLEQEDKVYTDQFVRINTPEEVIYGDGFESNQRFTRYRILNIRGTVALGSEAEADPKVD